MSIINKEHLEAQAIEDEMNLTWNPAKEHMIKVLPSPIKKKYYTNPINYQDTAEIWILENNQYVVYYSPTGAMFLFDKWIQALKFHNSRVRHIKVSYKAFR